MKKKELKRQHIIQLALSLVILVLVVFISSRMFFRVDLTSEKRFTLSNETKTILKNLDDVVYVKVYLEGDLPVGFKKLHNAIRETLDEFRVYGKSNIQYEFINPSESLSKDARYKQQNDLERKGLKAINIKSHDKEGGESEKIIFPGALITYNGRELPVGLLQNKFGLSPEENLNSSIQTVEYELVKGISGLTNKNVQRIGFLEGQGELSDMQIADIDQELSIRYTVEPVIIDSRPGILDSFKLIVVAKPTQQFKEKDKFVLDQYIMHGGKVLWLVDGVRVNTDSLANGATIGFVNNLNLDDQLFTYGVRINPNLVQDFNCNQIAISTGSEDGQSRLIPARWLYYPLVTPSPDNPISRSIEPVWFKYASQIDTLAVPTIKKTILLRSSNITKLVKAPLYIRLDEVKKNLVRSEFNKPFQPMAVLLEGRFPSLFRNRHAQDIIPGSNTLLATESVPNKMIVIADGDLIANDVRMTQRGPMYTVLGFDRYSQKTFGNKNFIMNAVDFLTDEPWLTGLRAKEYRLRLLDKERCTDERFKWQMINTVLPVLLVIGFGLFFNSLRKKRYAR